MQFLHASIVSFKQEVKQAKRVPKQRRKEKITEETYKEGRNKRGEGKPAKKIKMTNR
jgi:hypothetical protein